MAIIITKIYPQYDNMVISTPYDPYSNRIEHYIRNQQEFRIELINEDVKEILKNTEEAVIVE